MLIPLPRITNFILSGFPNFSTIGFGTMQIAPLDSSRFNDTVNSVSSFFHLVNESHAPTIINLWA